MGTWEKGEGGREEECIQKVGKEGDRKQEKWGKNYITLCN